MSEITESINRFLAGSDQPKGVRTRLVRARDEIVSLRKRLAAAEDRLESAEALMNRMAMNMMLSDHKAESNNNPIKEWLDLVIKWKKATRPEVKGE